MGKLDMKTLAVGGINVERYFGFPWTANSA